MKDEDKRFFGVMVAGILGAIFGFVCGVEVERSRFRADAIKHDAAEWRLIDKDGNVKWQWIDRAKPEWP